VLASFDVSIAKLVAVLHHNAAPQAPQWIVLLTGLKTPRAMWVYISLIDG
jgi:hypothetical protein